MWSSALLTATITILSIIVETQSASDRQVKGSVQRDAVKRRVPVSQAQRPLLRGRKKSIWSYNPGHRSLAFLVAGEVEVGSPPPGVEHHCVGCCGTNPPVSGRATAPPDVSNRVGRTLSRTDGVRALETEPNSVIDRCLGCCDNSVTLSPGVTTVTGEKHHKEGGRPTAGTRRATTARTMGSPRWQTQRRKVTLRPCTRPGCGPEGSAESSSSSEEVSHHRLRGRFHPIQRRTGHVCRHRGCRSALGRVPDSSSSSEED